MKIKENDKVMNPDGKTVGEVERVVIDPNTKEVTHIVVRKGFLLTTDKVMPIDLVAGNVEDGLMLSDSVELEQLPEYEETSYIPIDEYDRSQVADGYAAPVYWSPPYPYSGLAWGAYPPGYLPPTFVQKTKENIPEGTVALEEGSRVISADDKHVGSVEQVLVAPETDRVTHFVISAGLLFKHRKLVPASWIREIASEEVRLGVGASALEKLREYHPQPG